MTIRFLLGDTFSRAYKAVFMAIVMLMLLRRRVSRHEGRGVAAQAQNQSACDSFQVSKPTGQGFWGSVRFGGIEEAWADDGGFRGSTERSTIPEQSQQMGKIVDRDAKRNNKK
jgi:hypothetical protein